MTMNTIKERPSINVFDALVKAQQTYMSLIKDGCTEADIEYVCALINENISRLRILKQ